MIALAANLILRSALIVGAGLAAARFAPRLRPAQRHLIVLSSFLLLLFWPLLAGWLPKLVVRVGTQVTQQASVTVQQHIVGRNASPASLKWTINPVAIWAVIAFAALAPLFIAHFRLRVLIRRAKACENDAWLEMLDELCAQLGILKRPNLSIHPEPVMPMAVGIFRPAIVLPAESARWHDFRLRIVLLHELAHVKRRDLLWQTLARLISSVWWFQPLCWSSSSFLRRESEKACDELVVSCGVRPSFYASELISIAQAFNRNQNVWSTGIAMARHDGLPVRLNSILGHPAAKFERPIFSVVCLLSVATLTLAASAITVSTVSQPHFLLKRGHPMKHTLLAGLLASAGLSAATISGSIYDPSGAPVPNARALLFEPDRKSQGRSHHFPGRPLCFRGAACR